MTHSFLYLYVASLIFIPIVLVRKYEPAAAVAWILALIFLPIIGGLFFIIFGIRFAGRGTSVVRRANKEIRKFARRYRALHHEEFCGIPPALRESPGLRLCSHISPFEPCGGNQVIYSVDAHKTYELMEQVILSAEHHIHLEFYIFTPDRVGLRFIELLMKKAREGVEVRFLYDSLGSWALHRRKDLRRRMTEAGVKIEPFILTRLIFRPWYLHLRNHRKILVVDGKKGFVGGLNIGAAFLKPIERQEIWRDAMIFIQGPAVAGLQWIFIEDWHFLRGEALIDEPYFPKIEPYGDLMVQILGTGPDDKQETAELVFFSMITTARKKVYLASPYFVPDQAMLFALKSAALRGVDVRLNLPRRTDHISVYLAGRSYYDELISCGVQIFEFVGGVLHSKVLLVDDDLTIVSSVNMDIRSFRFNFEASAQIWGRPFADHVLAEFQENLAHSEPITLDRKSRRFTMQLLENGCRLLSPLL